MRLSGVFFAAMSAKETRGEIEISRQSATIYSEGKIVCSDIGIRSIQNKRDVYLDNDFLFALETSLSSEQENLLSSDLSKSINWLERFSFPKALIFAIVVICFVFLLRYSLNLIIPFVVGVFPANWEQKIGNNTYDAMERAVFEKSALSSQRIDRLRKKADVLAKANGFDAPNLIFHSSDLIGANALAFPGGPIVVTDDLVLLLQRDELILSVVAHEFAHVRERHSLQQIIEIVGIAAIASVILGSDDTLLEELSVVGLNLWANKNSREFEKQADLLAQQYLQKAGLEKSLFASAIRQLTEHYCSKTSARGVRDCVDETESGWFSSHPSGAERIEYLLKTP